MNPDLEKQIMQYFENVKTLKGDEFKSITENLNIRKPKKSEQPYYRKYENARK